MNVKTRNTKVSTLGLSLLIKVILLAYLTLFTKKRLEKCGAQILLVWMSAELSI